VAATPAPGPVNGEQGSRSPGRGAELNQRTRCVRRRLCERGSGSPAVVGWKGGTAAAAIVFVEASKHVARAASPGARALAHGQAHARAHNPRSLTRARRPYACCSPAPPRVRATGTPTSTARLATATKPEDGLAVGEESPPSRQAIATVRQSRSILCGCASAPPSCATPQPAQLAEAKVSHPPHPFFFVWMPVYLLWCLCSGKDMDMRPLCLRRRAAPRPCTAPTDALAHRRSHSPSRLLQRASAGPPSMRCRLCARTSATPRIAPGTTLRPAGLRARAAVMVCALPPSCRSCPWA